MSGNSLSSAVRNYFSDLRRRAEGAPDEKETASQAADPARASTQSQEPAQASWRRASETHRGEHGTGATARAASRIGLDFHVQGDIVGDEDLYVDGTVEGRSIQLAGHKLTVGPGAKVTANIVAGEVVVAGSVKGNVRAKVRVEIKKDGSVAGDLTTPQILIEDGAYFKGTIEIERSGDKEAQKEPSILEAPATNLSSSIESPRVEPAPPAARTARKYPRWQPTGESSGRQQVDDWR